MAPLTGQCILIGELDIVILILNFCHLPLSSDILIATVIVIVIVAICLQLQHRWLQLSGVQTPLVVEGANKLMGEKEHETAANLEGRGGGVVVQGVE